MGIYCKAYLLEQLRAFAEWSEDMSAVGSGGEGNRVFRVLQGDSVVYLHENLTVTEGIFQDEHVLYSGGSEAWAEFCRDELNFAIPEDVLRANELNKT